MSWVVIIVDKECRAFPPVFLKFILINKTLEPLPSNEGVRALQQWGLSPLTSSHGFMCDRLHVRADMCTQTRWTGEARRRHTPDNCLDSPGFVNYIPLEMNGARRRVLAPDHHQSEASSSLAMSQAELSGGANSLFALVRPRDPHYDCVTLATPNVKMSWGSASVPLNPTSPPLSLSRLSLQKKRVSHKQTKSCVFPLCVWTPTAENSPCLVHENDANESLVYTNDLAC